MAEYRYTGSAPGTTDGVGVWEPGETKTVADPAICERLDHSPLHERITPAAPTQTAAQDAQAALAAAREAEAAAEAAIAAANVTQGNTGAAQ